MDNKDRPDRPTEHENDPPKLRDDDRRDDGTKGTLDLDKDAVRHRQRKEQDDTSAEGSGTGIPGFGV